MDPSGAEALRSRLEQQRHWLLAASVQDGRQGRVDPDLAALLELRDDERVYRDEDGSWTATLATTSGGGGGTSTCTVQPGAAGSGTRWAAGPAPACAS